MESRFGWTVLSREALRRAEDKLAENIEGVRDEIGFMGLHQAYADRFFPGTSVQQTRLRYALFVPWIYERIHERGAGRRIASELKEEERTLAGRLLRGGDQKGVIGGYVYPQPSVIPPSLIYWTALTRWRIVRPLADGSLPARSTIHRAIARPRGSATRLHDDEHQMLEETESIFASLPTPPKNWNNSSQPLDFALASSEARYLRKYLVAVGRPGEPHVRSLLSRLVEVPIAASTDLWMQKIADAADQEDREVLVHAQRASALAAIGRGVYAALVETIRERDDGVPTGKRHRGRLCEVIDEFRADALALNLDCLLRDAPGLSRRLVDVLDALQQWLKGSGASLVDLKPLQPLFEKAEHRKGQRARLAMTLIGRERRAEWDPGKHKLAEPLHYRWPHTRRLLLDLQAAG